MCNPDADLEDIGDHGNTHRYGAVGGRAITELTIKVPAPALDVVVGCHRTEVLVTHTIRKRGGGENRA